MHRALPILGCFAATAVIAVLADVPLWPAAMIAATAALAVGLGVLMAPKPPVARDAGMPREPPAALQLLSLLDAAPAAMIVTDSKGAVAGQNRKAREAFGAIPGGQPIFFRFRDPDLTANLESVLARGELREFEFRDYGGTETFYRISAAPFDVKTGGPLAGGMLLTFTDLTDIRRTEAMRVDFIANASHELRTPLASLLGFIQTLQGPARDDNAVRQKFLGVMNEQARRMARLIDDLLSLSRIERQAHIRPDTHVDLNGLIQQIMDSLSDLARSNGVALKFAPEAQAPVIVQGDRDELLRMIENLVENGIKYGQSGGKVDITLARSLAARGETITLSVRDCGPGIAPEHLPRLTERFYRVDAGSSRAKGGTGLGLALVKHIANRHGGQLEIISTPGAGAEFRVSLPLHPKPLQQG